MLMMSECGCQSQELYSPTLEEVKASQLDSDDTADVSVEQEVVEQEIIASVNQVILKPSRRSLEASFNASIEQAMADFETTDLLVKIHKPEKVVKPMESYVLFTVSTKASRSGFDQPEYTVRRRYNDFLWLRQQLCLLHPALLVPPLPEKQSLTVDRFDAEFIRFREAALNRFIDKISDHPLLSQAKQFHSFLTMETAVFSRLRKETGGIISLVTGSFSSISSSYKGSGTLSSIEFKELYKYVERFESRLSSLERITHRLGAEQTAYADDLQQSSLFYRNWAGIDTSLTDVLTHISQLYQATASFYSALIDETSLQLILPIREYILYCDVVRSSIVKRDSMYKNVQALGDSAKKLEALKDRMLHVNGNDSITASIGDGSRQSADTDVITGQVKKSSIDSRILQAVEERDKAYDLLEVSNADFQADFERWHVVKKQDMKKLISTMAERNISFYDEQVSLLEVKLAQLRDLKTRAT